MLVPPFLDYLWNCQEDRGLKNASREEKKKGASANEWLKPVVAGQNQGFQLQATETNSDRFKKKNFSKSYWIITEKTEKQDEKTQELGTQDRIWGHRYNPSLERVRWGYPCCHCWVLHLGFHHHCLQPSKPWAVGTWIFLSPCSLPEKGFSNVPLCWCQ